MSVYDKPKKGPVPVDMKGFEKIIINVKSSLKRNPTASILYVKNVGFKVVTKIREKMKLLIDENKVVIVGLYSEGVHAEYLVEDLVYMTDQIAQGELN